MIVTGCPRIFDMLDDIFRGFIPDVLAMELENNSFFTVKLVEECGAWTDINIGKTFYS